MKISLFLVMMIFGTFALAEETAVTKLKAYYEVPTSQPELLKANRFAVQEIEMRKNSNGTTDIKYLVPEELTGIKNEVSFNGKLTIDGGTLQSENGNLNCVGNSVELMCSVSYMKVQIDSELAKLKMTEKFLNRNLEKRLQIQEKFSTDPVGILHIRKNKNLHLN